MTTTPSPSTRRAGSLAVLLAAALALGAGPAAGAGPESIAATPPGFGDPVAGEYIVRFAPGATTADRAAVLGPEGANVVQGLGTPGVNLIRTADAGAVAAIRADPRVLWVEPNRTGRYEAVPNDTLFPRQWGLDNTGQAVPDSDGPDQRAFPGTADADIDAPEAWNRTTGDPAVIVAIADSGVAYDHPDLAPNMWHNPGESGGGKETNGLDDDGNGFVDDVVGWDFVGKDADPRDLAGHGTEVAGVVGARGSDGAGVTGVNQRVSLMALRSGADVPDTAALAAAFAYAARNGAKVVNASLTVPPSQAITDAIAAAPGVLFVVAAGNQGADVEANPAAFPCNLTAPNLICVASTDQNDALVDSSNRGRVSVDLAAPGDTVWTTRISSSNPAYETWAPDNPLDWRATGTWQRLTLGDGSVVWSDSPGTAYANNSDTAVATNRGFSTAGQFGCTLKTTVSLDIAPPDVLAIEAAAEGAPFTRLSVLTARSNGFEEVTTPLTGLDDTAQVFLRYRLISDGAVVGDGAALKYVIVSCVSTTYRGSEFAAASGTSFASPMTAGVAALVWAAAPRATVAQVRAAILGGVDPVPALAATTVTGGRLNAAHALANIVAAVGSGGPSATPPSRRLKLLSARLLPGRRAALRVRCPAAAATGCAGRLAIRSLALPRRGARPAVRARTLASARFALARSRTKVVTVTLSRASFRTLVRGGRRALLVVDTTAAGKVSRAQIRVRLAQVRR